MNPAGSFNAQTSVDPSAVTRRLVAISDILQVQGRFQRIPHQLGEDPNTPLEPQFRGPQTSVQLRGENLIAVLIGYQCMLCMPGSDKSKIEAELQAGSPSVISSGLRFLAHADFHITYQIGPGVAPTQAELDAFGVLNAPLNCTPYWREFLDSALRRSGLPPVLAPLYKSDPQTNAPASEV